MKRLVHGIEIYGADIDAETRCGHWNGELDVVAIRFKCCGKWFPCFKCHAESADHDAIAWPKQEFDEKAILCGSCGYILDIAEYLGSYSRCPRCKAGFNPGCAKHYHLYFESFSGA